MFWQTMKLNTLGWTKGLLSRHPIIGDDTYGGGESAAAGFLRRNEVMSASAARSIAESCARPMLHARSLGFVHPVSGEDVNFAVDPPLDFVDVFTELSKY